MLKEYVHQPVLLAEVIENLALRPDGTYIDATFGRGGYSQAILQQLGPEGRLIAIDKDPEAVQFAQQLLGHDKRFSIVHASFAELQVIASQYGVLGKVNGITLDLGVSSPQLEDAERGFSFLKDGPLDMRMDTSQGKTAAEWLAQEQEGKIAAVLRELGEERYARRIARAIVHEREQEPIRTTGRLAAIVRAANPAWEKHKHPATRVFQAIRIFINQELAELQTVLENLLAVLALGGRLAVVSFHSLEDRMVKRFIRRYSRDEELPVYLPVMSSQLKPSLRSLGQAIKAKESELAVNPRSRSAVLRIAEKIV